MCDELGHYISTYMSSTLKDERWEGLNKVGLANKKVARQLGQVAMKARWSRVQLRSIIIDWSNTVGSSTQPCGIATRNNMDIVVAGFMQLLSMVRFL
jgi:hypothetical protein